MGSGPGKQGRVAAWFSGMRKARSFVFVQVDCVLFQELQV